MSAAEVSAYKAYAASQADAYGIPRDYFLNLINTESAWNPNAISSKGAEGIAQLMPGTAPSINRFDPYASMSFAASLLRQYFDKFGDWGLAAAAYNAGPGAVTKYNGIPPYAETQSFVSKVIGSKSSTATAPDLASGTTEETSMPKIIFWSAAAIVLIVVLRGVVSR